MSTSKKITNTGALDSDVVELLAESFEPADMPAELQSKLHDTLMQQVAKQAACEAEGYTTVRASDDSWIHPLPGASLKVLNREPGSEGIDGVLSYLLRLEPGFKSKGHNHPVDEECLMLEGDLTLGGLTLNAGDYHLVAAGLLHGNVSTVNGCMAFIRGAVPV